MLLCNFSEKEENSKKFLYYNELVLHLNNKIDNLIKLLIIYLNDYDNLKPSEKFLLELKDKKTYSSSYRRLLILIKIFQDNLKKNINFSN
jgi:hypothetical protein